MQLLPAQSWTAPLLALPLNPCMQCMLCRMPPAKWLQVQVLASGNRQGTWSTRLARPPSGFGLVCQMPQALGCTPPPSFHLCACFLTQTHARFLVRQVMLVSLALTLIRGAAFGVSAPRLFSPQQRKRQLFRQAQLT